MEHHVIGPSGDMNSPLKHFTNAKKKINSIFSEIGTYIKEFSAFLESMEKDESGVELDKTLKEEVNQAFDQVFGIKEMLVRDHMKVVFFGRTSNGKSTVINSMLWNRILPSGIGHTTSCFLSIEGCDDDVEDVGYILCGDSNERMSIESVMQLSHALSQESMSCDNIIQIFWPKKKCALLKDDVVLLDSPGIDVSTDLDNWIENFCMDADVFILVANAESTLMQAEKNFFHRVNSKLSKPNIFILNNRWDASASEPETMEQVRKQHMDRGIAFLADELKVIDKEQARNRVFFVSAKEVLHSRVKKSPIPESPMHSDYMAEGFQARLLEFSNFEREFEECISRHATRTKFSSHTQRAEKVIDVMFKHAQWLHTSASEMIKESEVRRTKLLSRLREIDEQLRIIHNQSRESIALVSNEAEKQVRTAMSDEIRRLPFLVDDFQLPFHPNPMVLRVYKDELYKHIQEGLGRNLTARCSAALQKQINRNKQNMIDGIKPLLLIYPTDNEAQQHNGVEDSNGVEIVQPSFDISYDIECASLCADFQEDIEFKFSLGVFQIIERLVGAKDGRRMRLGGVMVERPQIPAIQHPAGARAHPAIPDNHEGIHAVPQPMAPKDLALSLASGYMNFTEAHSTAFVATMGMLPYVFWRSVGWRVLAITGAAYFSLYFYERLTWTSGAKERALKRQFVEHATDKLKYIIDFTSTNCSHQVQQELSQTLSRLCCDVDSARNELKEESEELTAQIQSLKKTQSRAKTLRNNAGWLGSELQNFSKTFLAPLHVEQNGSF